MTQRNKALIRVKEKPPRSDITYDELVSVLEYLGFNDKRTKSSHHVFINPDYPDQPFLFPDNHGRPIKKAYIANLQKIIERIEEE